MSVNWQIVDPESVRLYIGLTNPAASLRYANSEIGSNVRAATYWLERLTRRYIADRPDPKTLKFTTNGQANIYLPNLRAASSVQSSGQTMVEDQGYWLRTDEQRSGVFTGIQLRAYTNRGDGAWYLGNPEWWDRNLDSPWHPANRVGGNGYDTGLPNDLIITGSWGYEAGSEDPTTLHNVKVLAAWFTQRGNALLGGVAADPSGNVVDYSLWPSEVINYISEFGIGSQADMIG